jgi:tetratricopeptide (TPR) repeat protein
VPGAHDGLEARRARLEQRLDHRPGDFTARLELAETCYQLARRFLDGGDEASYAQHIGCAQREFLEAAALRPRSPAPHLGMGIVLAYEADMPSALRSFENARRLEPDAAVHYVNMAQALTYLGRLEEAERALEQATRRAAPAPWVRLGEVLIAWRRGELARARDLFALAYSLDPAFVRSWDGAPVTAPVDSFDALAGYCCGNLSCGRHMAQACREVQLDLKRRELALHTLRLQYELERERRRRLREIYGGQTEVTIEIEEAAD